MPKYTYEFSGQITIEADSQEEAYEKADDLLGATAYQADNCESIGIYDIELIDEEDDEE